MRDILIKDIIKVTDGKLLKELSEAEKDNVLNTEIDDIVIDSRKVTPSSVFVAIKGENVDAHKFIPDVANTCKAILTEEDINEISEVSGGKTLPEDVAYIKVDNVLDSLQALGGYVRSKYEHKVIGVTGSVGKTTTREMISHALASSLEVFHTEGNMNSQIGVPITVSHINDKSSDVAVLELGISEAGGMDRLTKIAMPDIGVVTMIGVAHIEFMKTREGIRTEKLRIAGRMNENGVLFLNADDDLLWAVRNTLSVKTFYYGENPEADYKAENIEMHDGFNTYDYVHGDTRINVKLSALGRHNVKNSLVAMAICDYMGLDLNKAAESFASFTGLRQQIIKADKGYTIIDDTYNASPDSMKAAIRVMGDMSCKGKKIAVLGDMYELGENSDEYHASVGEYINENSSYVDELITIGESSIKIFEAAGGSVTSKKHFKTKEEATSYIKESLGSEDIILLKASNGMKLSEIVKEIK